MTASLPTLLTPKTDSDYVSENLSSLKLEGVSVDQWKDSTNLGYAMVQSLSQGEAVLSQNNTTVQAGCFLQYATGDTVDIRAQSEYILTRLTASVTTIQVRLLSLPSTPTKTFAVGDITLGTQGGDPTLTKYFTNTTGGTLAPNSHLDLLFTATQSGSAYNIPNGTLLDLKTSFVGVSVSNPLNPLGASCVINTGTDVETDDALKLRCVSKWGTLGAGGNQDAYIYWATYPINGGTSSPVSHVRIATNLYFGSIRPGAATVFVAGPNGALSSMDITAIQANFDGPPQKYPMNDRVQVLNAVIVPVIISGVVYIHRSYNVSSSLIQQQVEAALLDYQGTLNIGDQSIYPDKIISWITSRPEDNTQVKNNLNAIRNVVLSQPTKVIILNYDEYPVLNYTAGLISYQLVD